MLWPKTRTAFFLLFVPLLGLAAGLLQTGVRPNAAASVPLLESESVKNGPRWSKPAVERGLSVTIKAAKARFSQNEPMEFEVTFTNVSRRPYLLYDSGFWRWEHLFGCTTPVFVSDSTAIIGWKPVKFFEEQKAVVAPLKLDPSKSTTTKVRFDPKKDRLGFSSILQFGFDGVPHMNGIPTITKPVLPPGRYTYIVTMIFSDHMASRRGVITPYWTGTMTTNPVEIEIIESKK